MIILSCCGKKFDKGILQATLMQNGDIFDVENV
jgi:hypothetical protein